jgi:hypothetical protein
MKIRWGSVEAAVGAGGVVEVGEYPYQWMIHKLAGIRICIPYGFNLL